MYAHAGTLCKAKVDGVQLFSTYITQLLAAGLVEPTAEVVRLCRTGDFRCDDSA